MKRFTFDTIHRDSFSRQFHIRYASPLDKADNTFETLEDVRACLNKSMKGDVFICSEIFDDVFGQ